MQRLYSWRGVILLCLGYMVQIHMGVHEKPCWNHMIVKKASGVLEDMLNEEKHRNGTYQSKR